MYDEMGKRYLDCFGGIVTVSVGHCHPAVTEAAVKQVSKLAHSTTIYLNPEVGSLAKELTAKMPKELSVCYFVNSGSEANDLAMLMARCYTRNHDIIALRNAYHGMSPSTMGLTAHSTWKYNVPQGSGVHHAVNPDGYRGPFGYDDPDAATKYAADVQNLIQHSTSGQLAAFFAESIQGVGGTVVFPEGYLKQVYEIVRKHGGLCIADEVQTGFGRMGSHYWGFEVEGVVPDIVTMAKGIGNGAPLAAVVTTPAIAQALTSRIHFNTFGGNPVSSTIGRAVIRTIDSDHLQQNSAIQGETFKKGLLALKDKYASIIGDVRGRGLMLGVDLVKCPKSKEGDKQAATDVMEYCKDHQVLIGRGGYFGNVLRIKPPMCINEHDVAYALSVLDHAFASLKK